LRPDAFRMKPADFSSAEGDKPRKRNGRKGPRQPNRMRGNSCDGKRRMDGQSQTTSASREIDRSKKRCGLQLRRFRPPLVARVEFRERLPVLIRSGVCNGRIVDRRGPFLLSGNWWDDGRWWREEWDVQMPDGKMYRVFRAIQKRACSAQASPASEEEREKTNLAAADECFVEGVYD
jgi:hypothetical protein